jgi:sensor histidine kinase YesM
MIKDPSTGIGLQNLKNRYRLLNDSVIEVTAENGVFIVKLPLIKS